MNIINIKIAESINIYLFSQFSHFVYLYKYSNFLLYEFCT